MTDTDALLPCPFCGHPPIYRQMPNDGRWIIDCNTVTCIRPTTGICKSEAEAITRWNARPSTPPSDDALVESVAMALFDDHWLDDLDLTPCHWLDAAPQERLAWEYTARAVIPIAQAPILAQLADNERCIAELVATAETLASHCRKELTEREATIAHMAEALGQVAGKNDLSAAPDDEIEAYARMALYECELITRAALGESKP